MLELVQTNSCACLTEFLIEFQIQSKNRFCKRQAWTEENCIWFGRYWGRSLCQINLLRAWWGWKKGFPQLRNCGFELLWCVPNCRVLESKCTMAVKTLKTSFGHVKIYTRPIQRSLLVIQIRQEVLSITSLKEKCIYCWKQFWLKDLRSYRFMFQFPKLLEWWCLINWIYIRITTSFWWEPKCQWHQWKSKWK